MLHECGSASCLDVYRVRIVVHTRFDGEVYDPMLLSVDFGALEVEGAPEKVLRLYNTTGSATPVFIMILSLVAAEKQLRTFRFLVVCGHLSKTRRSCMARQWQQQRVADV